MEKPRVRIAGTHYLVELDGQDHYVSFRRCSCGRACQAVRLVAEYLASGGRPAPAGIPLPTLTVPKQCPLCGAEVKADHWLDGRKGRGWRCTQDPSHYWYVRSEPMRRWLQANRWGRKAVEQKAA